MKTITFLGILGVFPEKQGHFGDGGNPKFKRFFEGSPNLPNNNYWVWDGDRFLQKFEDTLRTGKAQNLGVFWEKP